MPLVTWQEFTAGGRPQGGTIKELVLAEVTNVTSRRRPLMSLLANRPASTTFIESLEDTLAARSHNAQLEGVAASDPTLSQPTRNFFHVQSFADWGVVSDEQRLVGHYNGDPYPYQIGKKMDKLLNDIEFALHRGSAATGATSAGRQLNGLLNIPGTTTFSHYSGVTLTERILIDMTQVYRDNSFDIVPRVAFVASWLKRTISEFSTKVTRNVDAVAKAQVLMIERHTADFHDVDVMYSEDQLRGNSLSAASNSIVLMDPEFFSLHWLRRPMVEPLSRDGLRDRFQMNAMVALVYETVKAIGGGDNLLPNLTTA